MHKFYGKLGLRGHFTMDSEQTIIIIIQLRHNYHLCGRKHMGIPIGYINTFMSQSIRNGDSREPPYQSADWCGCVGYHESVFVSLRWQHSHGAFRGGSKISWLGICGHLHWSAEIPNWKIPQIQTIQVRFEVSFISIIPCAIRFLPLCTEKICFRLLIFVESAATFNFPPLFEPLVYGLDCRNKTHFLIFFRRLITAAGMRALWIVENYIIMYAI